MINYQTYLDADIWAFIERTTSFYPEDTANRPVTEQRKIYNTMCRAFDQGRPSGVAVENWKIGALALRSYKAESHSNAAARVLYFHGGGFVVGGLDSHDDVCAELCARTGFEVTAVDYRLAPESQFPSDFEDALAAWDHMATTNGAIVLVGDSAGGTLCAGLSHSLRGSKRSPVGQVLIYPSLGAGLDTNSMIAHANAPMLTRADCVYYKDMRLGKDLSWLEDPRCCPLAALDMSGLPPTVAFAAECDPLADDARLYVERCRAVGASAELVFEQGLIHGYLRARHSTKRGRASFDRIVKATAKLGAKIGA